MEEDGARREGTRENIDAVPSSLSALLLGFSPPTHSSGSLSRSRTLASQSRARLGSPADQPFFPFLISPSLPRTRTRICLSPSLLSSLSLCRPLRLT